MAGHKIMQNWTQHAQVTPEPKPYARIEFMPQFIPH